MYNDFKENCIGAVADVWNSQKSTKRIRIFSNVFFTVVSLGVIAACVMLEIPYNFVTEIINGYKTDS